MRSVLLFAGLAASCQVIAQDSADFARMSRASWAAFECAALASVLERPADQERLFHYGYDQGKKFLVAAQAGRVEKSDINSIAPSGFLMVAQGPTIDFMLGRVFESAQENALKDVITADTVLHDDLKQSLASNKFVAGNCEILGREP
ncbi:hypothetical protein [Arenimonas daejeonensis]|uniref:hypothetical protein n=1 Tax=Arenimonas daejeonensis TaxID=370777 RepID=UPI0011BEBD74|nr:hypothetical protein [Arenimonas daejeonensis]